MAHMRLFLDSEKPVSAPDVVGSLFVAQRAALKAIRSEVLAGAGLTSELAELLLELYIAGQRGDGFIPIRDLLGALDYTPGLLSRRMGWLCRQRWVESRKAAADISGGVHGNCRQVRMTERGKSKFAPVWRRYVEHTERSLRGVSAADLAACRRVHEIMAGKIPSPPPAPRPQPASRHWTEPEREFLD